MRDVRQGTCALCDHDEVIATPAMETGGKESWRHQLHAAETPPTAVLGSVDKFGDQQVPPMAVMRMAHGLAKRFSRRISSRGINFSTPSRHSAAIGCATAACSRD